MAEINILLKLKNLLGTVINPRKEDGHGSAAGTPTHVSVAASALPTGAATAAKQDSQQTTLASLLGQLDITLSALRDALKGGKTLGDIWTSLQTQREISTSLWTDDSGAKYVRRDTVDESTGTITVTFTNETGGAATPGVGLRPLASTDKETIEALFTVVTAGTGYAVGDILARVLVVDTSVTPPFMTSTWMNVTAGTIIAAPNAAHLDQFVGLTDQELSARMNTLGQKASTASLPAVLSAEQEAMLAKITSHVNATITGTIAASGQSVALTVPDGMSAANFQLTGAFVGSVVFESSVDGGTTYNGRVYRSAGILNNLQTGTSTFPSEWRGNVGGMSHVRVRCTAYTSGTLTVVFRASVGPAAVFLNAAIPIGAQSIGNIYSAALTAGSNTGGVYENLENVAEVAISASLNQAGTLTLQWSQDGSTLFVSETITIVSGVGKYLHVKPRTQFLKIFLTNTSASVASQARLETVYRAVKTGGPSIALDSLTDIKDTMLPDLTASILVARKAANSYVALTGDESGLRIQDGTAYAFGTGKLRVVGGNVVVGVGGTATFRMENPTGSGKNILSVAAFFASTASGNATFNKNGTLPAPVAITPWNPNFAGVDTTVAVVQKQDAAVTGGTALAASVRIPADVTRPVTVPVLLTPGTAINFSVALTAGGTVHCDVVYIEGP